MLQCNMIRPARKSDTGISPTKRTFTMKFFKTETSIPSNLHFADRPRFSGAAIRYGNARLRRSVRSTAVDAPAPVLVELPRVQAVVDAIVYARVA